MKNTLIKRFLGKSKWRVGNALQITSYLVSAPWSRHFIRDFWESQADYIDKRWGRSSHDYEVLGKLLNTYRPHSILDVGCGSGRLFKLYAEYGVSDVVGVDLSARALALAQEYYPTVPTIQSRLEDMEFPPGRFDLAVCNRVLQHVPCYAIAQTIDRITGSCRLVYINELTPSDEEQETFFMFCHDYPSLFRPRGFGLLETGQLGKQTFQLYGRRSMGVVDP